MNSVLASQSPSPCLVGLMTDYDIMATLFSVVRDRLCLCCGVVMNVCVSAPDVVREDRDGSFVTLTSLMLQLITKGKAKPPFCPTPLFSISSQYDI